MIGLSVSAHILDSKSMEDFARDITDVPEVFDVLNAAMVATFGCELSHISALFTLAYANAAGGMMNLLLVENQSAQEFRVKGGSQRISQKIGERIYYLGDLMSPCNFLAVSAYGVGHILVKTEALKISKFWRRILITKVLA